MMASVISARSESALRARGHSTLGTMPGTSYRFCDERTLCLAGHLLRVGPERLWSTRSWSRSTAAGSETPTSHGPSGEVDRESAWPKKCARTAPRM